MKNSNKTLLSLVGELLLKPGEFSLVEKGVLRRTSRLVLVPVLSKWLRITAIPRLWVKQIESNCVLRINKHDFPIDEQQQARPCCRLLLLYRRLLRSAVAYPSRNWMGIYQAIQQEEFRENIGMDPLDEKMKTKVEMA
jgi:hypothetical protein